MWLNNILYTGLCGVGSSVGIATDYGLDSPGIKSRWGWDFLPVQTSPGAHPASCKMGTGSFPGVKCSQGVPLTTHPLLALRLWKSRAIPLPTLWATTRPVTGLLYLLYRALAGARKKVLNMEFHQVEQFTTGQELKWSLFRQWRYMRGSRGSVPFIPDLGTRWRWVVNFMH